MMFYSMLLWFLFSVSLNIHMVNLQRITNFYVPRRASNQVDIDCKYDVQGKKLYGVNWYKDGQQFFRCNGDGTVQEYPIDGVIIRHLGSATVGACPLTLSVLNVHSGGDYKCEVTLDTDGFPMDVMSSRLDFLQPSKKSHIPDMVPKGSEKHTSQEETISISGCKGVSNNFMVLLLLFMYIILI